FTHPVLMSSWQERGCEGKRPLTVRKSLSTPDKNEALALRDQFQRIIDDETSWFDLPADIDPRVEEIWKGDWWSGFYDMDLGRSVSLRSKEGQGSEGFELVRVVKGKDLPLPNLLDGPSPLDESILPPFVDLPKDQRLKRRPTGKRVFAPSEKIDTAASEIVALRSEVKRLTKELTLSRAREEGLHEKLRSTEATLKAVNRKIVVDEDGTLLKEGVANFFKSIDKGNSAIYLRRVRGILNPFVVAACKQHRGAKNSAYDISEAWVGEYIRNYLKRDGSPPTLKFKKDLKAYIGRFMVFATKNRFDRTLVKVPTRNAAKSASDIHWLDQDECVALLEVLEAEHEAVWADLARVQRFMGWRTSELIWLRASGVSDGSVSFENFVHPHTKERIGKTGARRIAIPNTLKETFERLVEKAKEDLLFPVEGVDLRSRRGWTQPFKSAWDQREFQKAYKKRLTHAAVSAGIEKPICCRILRRTFASQLLRDGRTVEQVATLLGDDPGTVKRHYARILPDEIDTNLSFI
ncbi:MAG: tyrosine-type recombinase/integrase, partial [Planctomycetes bacterium]|nr:tyrosine-type recombinase/integrase [Planctomycetota bacterium]